MRHAAHLCTSRHGIFYFRWPLPRHLHPARKATDIKVSLGTRLPQVAKRLSRVLVCAGQSATIAASVHRMRYAEIRQHVLEHFQDLLAKVRQESAEDGPMPDDRLAVMRGSVTLAEAPTEDFLSILYPDGTESFLRDFCDRRGMAYAEISEATRRTILAEIQSGYRSFLNAALDHNASFDRYDLTADDAPDITRPVAEIGTVESTEMLAEVIKRYLDEGRRTGEWRAKTLDEKEDALELLLEVVGNKLVATVSKSDARKTKDVLLKLPKNRRKSALTRNLSIGQLTATTGLTLISSRTLNSYLSQFQSFMGWAANQGYCSGNVFEGLRVARKSGASADDRRAFSPEQLKTLYLHLTDNPDGFVQKDDHKWPCLIGLFSGARLNEIAQLTPDDLIDRDGIWCFDFNDDGEKLLKNSSSRRIVPIHSRLLELGFLDFAAARRRSSPGRMFASLTYSKQNGYGRNVGRWFNERLLPSLHMKDKGLVFHCLRHTLITRLLQADVPDPIVKAVVGHSQVGVTHTHYAKEGYRVEQLQRAVNQFGF